MNQRCRNWVMIRYVSRYKWMIMLNFMQNPRGILSPTTKSGIVTASPQPGLCEKRCPPPHTCVPCGQLLRQDGFLFAPASLWDVGLHLCCTDGKWSSWEDLWFLNRSASSVCHYHSAARELGSDRSSCRGCRCHAFGGFQLRAVGKWPRLSWILFMWL